MFLSFVPTDNLVSFVMIKTSSCQFSLLNVRKTIGFILSTCPDTIKISQLLGNDFPAFLIHKMYMDFRLVDD